MLGVKKSTPLIKIVAGLRAVFLLMRGRGVDGRSTACNYERASLRPMYLPERAHLAHQEGLIDASVRKPAAMYYRSRPGSALEQA